MLLGAWEGDYAHINHLKRSLLFILMTVDMKNIIYSNNNITSNRNELVRRLLSGITMSELQNLVNIREEARPIPAPRRRGGGGGRTPYSCSKKKDSNSYTKEKCTTINTVFRG